MFRRRNCWSCWAGPAVTARPRGPRRAMDPARDEHALRSIFCCCFFFEVGWFYCFFSFWFFAKTNRRQRSSRAGSHGDSFIWEVWESRLTMLRECVCVYAAVRVRLLCVVAGVLKEGVQKINQSRKHLFLLSVPRHRYFHLFFPSSPLRFASSVLSSSFFNSSFRFRFPPPAPGWGRKGKKK